MSEQRIAVAHEWIDARAGSEQVFAAIARACPSADLYALTKEPGVDLGLDGRRIATTWLDRPRLRRHRGATLPAMPLAWRTLRAPRYDAVISSHHAFAHANHLAPIQLCYVHSPARYIWTPEIDARGANTALAPIRAAMKWLDRGFASRVTAYAANSTAVAARVARFWGREATVIHPPVNVEFYARTPESEPPPTKNYVLGVGRWIAYKNLDLVIAAGSVAGIPVKIAGRGPERARLEEAARCARVPVEIIESPTDVELRRLYRNAATLIFPSVEDFGLVPVEAQAAGTPVIAPAAGGAIDTVVATSGVLVDELTADALAEAIPLAAKLNSDLCRANASRFNLHRFIVSLRAWCASYGVVVDDRVIEQD